MAVLICAPLTVSAAAEISVFSLEVTHLLELCLKSSLTVLRQTGDKLT